jgi:hypothetical protein
MTKRLHGVLKMSEKKVVRRSVAIALGIICIILVIGLVGMFAYYTIGVNIGGITSGGWEKKYNDYAGTHHHSDDEYNSLQSNYNNYMASHHHTDDEYNSIVAPKLISVNLKAEDNRPWFQTPYVHVYGYVVNVGSNTANDAKIHVILYQSGGAIAKDTYITLGSVNGESYTSVDTKVYYEGSEITSQTITLQWT